MKKILSICLVLCMVLSLSTTAFAANITEDGTQSGSMTVMYGVEDSYIINIPDNVTIDSTLTVSATNVMLSTSTALFVYIHGDSFANGMWHLTDTEKANNKLGYMISDGIATIHPDDAVLYVATGEAYNSTVSTTLYLSLAEDATIAGTYTDLLTFTVVPEQTAEDSLYGTYWINIGPDELEAKSLRLSDEELEAIESFDTDDEVAEYLLDRYGVEIAPYVYYNSYEANYTQTIAGTPPFILDNGEVFHVALMQDEDGDTWYDIVSLWGFIVTFGFDASEDMPETTLQFIKQHGVKISNQIYTTIENNVEHASFTDDYFLYLEGYTWNEWMRSHLYDDRYVNVDGYVYDIEDGQYLVYNNEFVRINDSMQIGTYTATQFLPECELIAFTINDSAEPLNVPRGMTWGELSSFWSIITHDENYVYWWGSAINLNGVDVQADDVIQPVNYRTY